MHRTAAERLNSSQRLLDLGEKGVYSSYTQPGSLLKRAFKSRITRDEAAAMMVRQIVLNAFAGIDKYFYYAWDNDFSGMVGRASHFHPSRDAMILVQRWLIGAKPGRCDIEEDRPTVCWGEKDGNPFAIVCNPTNSDFVDVPLPKGLRIARWLYRAGAGRRSL